MGDFSEAMELSEPGYQCWADLDPLADDEAEDCLLKLSDRQLLRLLVVAADTGGRFERDGVVVDPVAWLLTPRQLFGGRAAMVACAERQHLIRAIVLNGLSLGLDADPAYIDRLMEDGEGSSAAEVLQDLTLAEPPAASALLSVV